MRYLLDLTNCNLPWWPEGVHRILPAQIGKHVADLDLIPEEIAGYAEIEKAVVSHICNQGKNPKDLPVGFFLHTLPSGAVLTAVGKED